MNVCSLPCQILRGKWIRPMDYVTADSLFYCTNRALAAIGKDLLVQYSKCIWLILNTYLISVY